MAVNPRTHLAPLPYKRNDPPVDYKGVRLWLNDELLKISDTLNSLMEAVPQATDTPPQNPRVGLQRYAVAPWDPLGTGDAWVWWNGTAWVAL